MKSNVKSAKSTRINLTRRHPITVRELVDLYGRHTLAPTFDTTHPDRERQFSIGYKRVAARSLIIFVDLFGDFPVEKLTEREGFAFASQVSKSGQLQATRIALCRSVVGMLDYGIRHGMVATHALRFLVEKLPAGDLRKL
jgi:hypothetical protein